MSHWEHNYVHDINHVNYGEVHGKPVFIVGETYKYPKTVAKPREPYCAEYYQLPPVDHRYDINCLELCGDAVFAIFKIPIVIVCGAFIAIHWVGKNIYNFCKWCVGY